MAKKKPAKKHKPAAAPPLDEPMPAVTPAEAAPVASPPADDLYKDEEAPMDEAKADPRPATRVPLELPQYPGMPFPDEITFVPVPIDPAKAAPLAAPVKHDRVFLKPFEGWEPWRGRMILMTLPDGVSLPDIPDEGVFADVTLTPPAQS